MWELEVEHCTTTACYPQRTRLHEDEQYLGDHSSFFLAHAFLFIGRVTRRQTGDSGRRRGRGRLLRRYGGRGCLCDHLKRRMHDTCYYRTIPLQNERKPSKHYFRIDTNLRNDELKYQTVSPQLVLQRWLRVQLLKRWKLRQLPSTNTVDFSRVLV